MPRLITQNNKFPNSIFLKYRAFLLALLTDFSKQVDSQVLPLLDRYAVRVDEEQLANDPTEEIETALALYLLLQNARITRGISDQANLLERRSLEQFNALIEKQIELGQGGTTTASRQALIDAWKKENERLVRSMLSDEKETLLGLISRGLLTGESVSKLKKKIKEGLKRARNKAQLIAVNEIGNLSGGLDRLNALASGFNLYVWNTRLDERVRAGHRPLEGAICSWADSTIYKRSITDAWQSRAGINATTSHPKIDMRCRCSGDTVTGAIPENLLERKALKNVGRQEWLASMGIVDKI
jgi:hypothetical protein